MNTVQFLISKILAEQINNLFIYAYNNFFKVIFNLLIFITNQGIENFWWHHFHDSLEKLINIRVIEKLLERISGLKFLKWGWMVVRVFGRCLKMGLFNRS